MEALVLMRSMCGTRENLEIQTCSLQGMLDYVNESGCPYQNSRALMALIELHREHPTGVLRSLSERQKKRLYPPERSPGLLSFYEDPEPDLRQNAHGVPNYEAQTHQRGCPLWALCQWHELGADRKDLEAAGRSSRFLTQAKTWRSGHRSSV